MAAAVRAEGGWRRWVSFPVAVVLSLGHLYTAQFGMFQVLLQRSLHLAFMMVLIFLIYPLGGRAKGRWADAIDGVLIALSLLSFGYVVLYYDEISTREMLASPVSDAELLLGLAGIVLILEATRRTVGWALVLTVVISLIYVYVGPYLPWPLVHKGWDVRDIVAFMYLSLEGIYGIPLGVSATYAFLFILFGAFLYGTGVGGFFIILATRVAGAARGGPAKVAVIASALFGTISGATVANVFGTGNFTIPMMKRLGYSPNFAGAVEAVASAGGQIMPPVMGAVAFVMADVTGIPYVEVAKSAFLPALLYYLALVMMVHYEAIRKGLRALPREEVPSRQVVLRNSHLLFPVVFLIAILVVGFSPFRAAFWAIVATLAVSMVRAETRMGLRGVLGVLERGARDAVLIAAATACAGIIVGTVAMTGIAVEVTGLIMELGRETLLIPLIMSMIACMILGLELPTVPSYIIVAALAAPTLVKLGVPVMAAHLFVLYFAVIAVITPPVCSAAYAAASISGGDMMKTGFVAMRLGVVAYIVPFMFVYNPPLLLIGGWGEVALAFVTAVVGVVALAAGLEACLWHPMKMHEIGLFVVGGLLLIVPGWRTDLAGIACVGTGVLSQYLARGRRRSEEALA